MGLRLLGTGGAMTSGNVYRQQIEQQQKGLQGKVDLRLRAAGKA
jgi:hypothetical protein